MALQTTITKGVFQDETGAKKTSLVDIYNARPDLQTAFGKDALTAGTEGNRKLNDWYNTYGVKEYAGVKLAQPEEIKSGVGSVADTSGITTKPIDLEITPKPEKTDEDLSGVFARYGLTAPTVEETAPQSIDAPAKPAAPDLVKSYETLRTEKGVADLEGQLGNYKNQIKLQEDTLRQQEADLRSQQGVLSPQAERQTNEARRQAGIKLDELKRGHDRIVGELNMQNNVISTIMDLTKQNYATAKESYDNEFTRNIQMYNVLKGIDESQKTAQDRQADNARASLTAIYSKLTPDIVLSDEQKATITKLEMQAGYPMGLFDGIQSLAPEKEIQTVITSDDKTQFTILYKDGTMKMAATGLEISTPTTDKPLTINEIEQFRRSYGWTPPFDYTKSQLLQYIKDNPDATPEELEAGAKKALNEAGVASAQTFKITPESVIDYISNNMTSEQKNILKKRANKVGVSSIFRFAGTDIKNYLNTIKDNMQEAINEGYTQEEILNFLTS